MSLGFSSVTLTPLPRLTFREAGLPKGFFSLSLVLNSPHTFLGSLQGSGK